MSKNFQYNTGPLFDGGSPRSWNLPTHEFGIYTVELAKRYIPGTRYLTWDGRVFKYARCITALHSYKGCGSQDTAADAWTTAIATDVGSRSLNITMDSRTEDDLAGGYVEIYDSTINNSVMRGIIGNEATSGATTLCHLDYPIADEITAADSTEVFENPYIEIQASDTYVSCMGVAAHNATALQYFWLQTWGPCIISGGEDISAAREVVFDAAGALWKRASNTGFQEAGFTMTGTIAPGAGPLIMLKCSI